MITKITLLSQDEKIVCVAYVHIETISSRTIIKRQGKYYTFMPDNIIAFRFREAPILEIDNHEKPDAAINLEIDHSGFQPTDDDDKCPKCQTVLSRRDREDGFCPHCRYQLY